tara:strand:- start:1455 stop:2654 length:1200 start_codon:yes stop_codon:yes gene_type:complete
MLKEHKLNFSELVAFISFWILFPGFFFYHIGLSLSLYSNFLGGFFGIVSALLLPPLFFIYFFNVFDSPNKFRFIDALFISLLIYIFCVTLINFSFFSQAGNADLLVWNITGILFNFECYVILKFFNFNNKRIHFFLFLTFFMMVFFLGINLENNVLLILSSNTEDAVSYQAYARSMLLISFFLIAFMKGNLTKITIFIISTIALTVLGSRSELILFLGSIIATTYLLSCLSAYRFFVASFFSLIFISGIIFEIIPFLSLIEDFRVFELLQYGLIGSDSGSVRLMQIEFGWEAIKNSPIFGDYGSYVQHFGSIGHFPHHILSAWLNLGFLGFIFFLGISFYIFYQSTIDLIYKNNQESIFKVFLSLFILSAFLTSKDYTFMFFGLAVGAFSNCQSKEGTL